MPDINFLYLSANCNDVVIDNASITRVYSAKYLRIIIDVKFNWIEHLTLY